MSIVVSCRALIYIATQRWKKAFDLFKTLPESVFYKTKCFWTMFRVFLHKFIGLPISHYIRYFNIEMINYRALYNNHPKAYSGDLVLIRTPIASDNWHSDPLMGWKETIQGKIETFFVKSRLVLKK